MAIHQGEESTLFERWFFPASAAGLVILMVLAILLIRPHQKPDDAVKKYVEALARGKCSRAYGMTSSFVREYSPSYRTFDSFKENVCDPVLKNYVRVYVYRIDDMVPDTDSVVVYFRLKFRTSWMPKPSSRPMHFKLKRKGRKWLIDGPELEI